MLYLFTVGKIRQQIAASLLGVITREINETNGYVY